MTMANKTLAGISDETIISLGRALGKTRFFSYLLNNGYDPQEIKARISQIVQRRKKENGEIK